MGTVDIITILIPIYYLVMAAIVIVGLVALTKVVKRYLRNGKLAEEKFKLENEEIKDIKQRLDKIEAILKGIVFSPFSISVRWGFFCKKTTHDFNHGWFVITRLNQHYDKLAAHPPNLPAHQSAFQIEPVHLREVSHRFAQALSALRQ